MRRPEAFSTESGTIGLDPRETRLAEARLRELAGRCDLAVYRYRTMPTWRIIRLDSTLFVSAFDAGWEGHESATYKVMATPHGPLYRGFRRMFDALLADAERIV